MVEREVITLFVFHPPGDQPRQTFRSYALERDPRTGAGANGFLSRSLTLRFAGKQATTGQLRNS